MGYGRTYRRVTAISLVIRVAVTVQFATPWPGSASGCFGGEPDVAPRQGSRGAPTNGRVVITGRFQGSVTWHGPNGQRIPFRTRQVGTGPSAARVLTGESALPPGSHTIQTTDPDSRQTFFVANLEDSRPPLLSGQLVLTAANAADPTAECPKNLYVRAALPAPRDDYTSVDNFTYLIWVQRVGESASIHPNVVLLAESSDRGAVSFRFGETGCGCLPPFPLESGIAYRVTVRAVDGAGHESADSLSGTVTIP
jgi:hypothetical protein